MSLDRSTAGLRIRAQVARPRAPDDADAEFQGLYISEQEVDQLLPAPLGLPNWAASPGTARPAEVHDRLERIAASIASHKVRSPEAGVRLRLADLAKLFTSSPFDVDALSIRLAPGSARGTEN